MGLASKKPRKFSAVLDFSGKSVSLIITESRAIVAGMTGNPWFPSPPVPLATVTTAIDNVAAQQTKAGTGLRGAVPAMHALVVTLEGLLKQLASYVSNVANENAADGNAIIAGAHMYQRRKAAKTNNGYRVHATKTAGELFIMTVKVPRAFYEFEMTTDPNNASSWTLIYKGPKVKFIKTGLVSGTRYYIRVKTVTVAGESAPSDVLSSVVL
jgi:hypothetical protein